MDGKKDIEILRIGHRPERDKRITTHVALTARAFGASGIYIDTKDPAIEENIESVNRNFGGKFFVRSGIAPKEIASKNEFLKIHLTMYGMPLKDTIGKIKESQIKTGNGIMIIVGAEKVPFWAYEMSDFNVSVTSQPISEVSALAILMDRLNDGKELENLITGMRRIIPMERGKKVDYIPDGEECLLILQRNNASQRLLDHVFMVERLATRIASSCNANIEVVRAGAMLHDIGRTVTNGIDHAVKGAEILRTAKISEDIVKIVERHTGAGISKDEAEKLGLPVKDYTPVTLEEKIVAQADNLVSGNKIITLEEVVENYKRKNLVEAANKIVKLNEDIEKICGINIKEISQELIHG